MKRGLIAALDYPDIATGLAAAIRLEPNPGSFEAS